MVSQMPMSPDGGIPYGFSHNLSLMSGGQPLTPVSSRGMPFPRRSGSNSSHRTSNAFAGSRIASPSAASFAGYEEGSQASGMSQGVAVGSYSDVGITVCVRVKPESTDPSLSSRQGWDLTHTTVSAPEAGTFKYDHVFHPTSTNKDIYDNSVHNLVLGVLDGFNGTVFAYGMTGSGKTYSMQGSQGAPGIIPLAAKSIFEAVEKAPDYVGYQVKVCYLEIYNERINDLLNPNNLEEIRLREDPIMGIRVMNAVQEPVSNARELLEIIAEGDAVRKTEGTDYNARSSRSHAILQIEINAIEGADVRTSTLNLCDLAGSERATSQTERRVEGGFINKSLLTLGTIISRLNSSSSSTINHLPFRDSKLTRLLQPALSGKSLVSILCTVQLNNRGLFETINTLRFAARAKSINVQAKRSKFESQMDKNKLIEELRDQVRRLSADLELAKSQRSSSSELLSPSEDLTKQQQQQDDEVFTSMRLELQNAALVSKVEHLERYITSMQRKDDYTRVDPSSSTSELKEVIDRQTKQIRCFQDRIRDLETKPASDQMLPSPVPLMSLRFSDGVSCKLNLAKILKDQETEIRELRETCRDKEKIIQAIQGANKQLQDLRLLFQSSNNNNKAPPPQLSTLQILNDQELNHTRDRILHSEDKNGVIIDKEEVHI